MHCVVKLKTGSQRLAGFIVFNIKQILYLSRMVHFACVMYCVVHTSVYFFYIFH